VIVSMHAVAFYLAAAVALVSTVMVVINTNPVHALLYLVVSLLAVATVCFTFGAPFAGALEVIIYAGAIMVLFVFVVMTLNLGAKTVAQERQWMTGRRFIGPMLLSGVLLAELIVILWPAGELTPAGAQTITPKMVGIALYGPYLLIVELASMLLLGGLVAAYHLGRHQE
jgi:NADH-quinone oxidoreductase subunit J